MMVRAVPTRDHEKNITQYMVSNFIPIVCPHLQGKSKVGLYSKGKVDSTQYSNIYQKLGQAPAQVGKSLL